MPSLEGRLALVTGAAKRVGREIALSLAAEGAGLLLHYHRSAAAVDETRERCASLGVVAETGAADLRDAEAVERLGREAAGRGADVLVHNASTFSRTPFFETPPAAHARTLARDLRLHVEAPWLLGRILGERMAEAGWGRIVLLGDWTAGAAVYPHYGPYLASKAAVPALARLLALELGRRCPAVTVNAVLPGPILPPEGADAGEHAAVPRETILGEWIGPEEVARAVVFFVSSAGITGESLRVDGGRAARAR